MRRNVILSLVFHAAVIFVAAVGLPEIGKRDLNLDRPLVVDIVNVAAETNPPPPQAAAPPPPPPPPKPVAEPAPAPLPATKPEPIKEKPKEEARPPEPRLAKVQPKRKPPPPDEMASVLKTLEEIKQRPPKTEEAAKDRKRAPAEEKFDVAEIQKALTPRPRPHDPSKAISISEIDLVRQQIARCWNLPAGAKDAHKMTVEIRVVMNQDGTVREATLRDAARSQADPFYRAMAESALRAVLNPRCQPFKLPPDRYDIWQIMELNFDPKEIL